MSLKPYRFGKFSRSIQTFNLMEVALVVVILGTLVAIMLPIFGRGSANHSTMTANHSSGYPSASITRPAARVAVPTHHCAE